jgi:hypothetical protein
LASHPPTFRSGLCFRQYEKERISGAGSAAARTTFSHFSSNIVTGRSADKTIYIEAVRRIRMLRLEETVNAMTRIIIVDRCVKI